MTPYFFITYAWQRPRYQYGEWKYQNACSDVSPMEYLKKLRESSESAKEDVEYHIIFYSEITKDDFDKYNGDV